MMNCVLSANKSVLAKGLKELAVKIASAPADASGAPDPTAIETSALASKGASLTPSPIAQTRRPSVCSALMKSYLSSGLHPPR